MERTFVYGRRADPAHRRMLLGVSTLLFLVSVAETIHQCGSMSGGMSMPGGWTMSMMWMRMPGQTWFDSTLAFLWMWTVMMVAMMLPSLVPLLLDYRRSVLYTDRARHEGLTVMVGIGYFFLWALFGAIVYPLGIALADAEMRWSALSRAIPILTGVCLLLTGISQFTPWKANQLGHCRSRSTCAQPLPSDAWNAWQYGLRLGLHCILCCFGFTLTLLLIGVMDLRAMAIATVAITAERLAPNPRRVAHLIGAVAFMAGAFQIACALNIIPK